LKSEKGLEIYSARMKIEESFRDLKGLLGMERLMNKTKEKMEKMIALLSIMNTSKVWFSSRCGRALRCPAACCGVVHPPVHQVGYVK